MDYPLPGDRPGMLQQSEHGPLVRAQDAGTGTEGDISLWFLIAFTRSLIRLTGGDAVALAYMSALAMVPLTPEQELAFKNAVMHETAQSPYPSGFMPDAKL